MRLRIFFPLLLTHALHTHMHSLSRVCALIRAHSLCLSWSVSLALSLSRFRSRSLSFVHSLSLFLSLDLPLSPSPSLYTAHVKYLTLHTRPRFVSVQYIPSPLPAFHHQSSPPRVHIRVHLHACQYL